MTATPTDDYYYYSQATNATTLNSGNRCYVTTWRSVAIVAGVGWAVTSVLACCIVPIVEERDEALRSGGNANNNDHHKALEVTAISYDVPIDTKSYEPTTANVTKMPNGTKRTGIITMNSDGTETVTVQEEEPSYP